MFTLKMSKIQEIYPSIKEFMGIKLSINTSMKLVNIHDLLLKPLTELDKRKQELFEELGEIVESGGYQIKDEDSIKTFNETFKPLLEEDIEFDFEKIPLSSLGDIEVEPNVLKDLDIIIDFNS